MPTTLSSLPDSPIGPIAIAATRAGLLAVAIGVEDLTAWAARISPKTTDFTTTREPHLAVKQLREYFNGQRQAFELSLDMKARSAFQRKVYAQVRAVPYGETRTYAGIAAEIGRPKAYRAVGRANAANPLAIIVPCHRLVGADGSLRGYAAPGGIETKAWLLDFERRTRSGMGV